MSSLCTRLRNHASIIVAIKWCYILVTLICSVPMFNGQMLKTERFFVHEELRIEYKSDDVMGNRSGYFMKTDGCAIPYVDPLADEFVMRFEKQNLVDCDARQPLVDTVFVEDIKVYLLHTNESVLMDYMDPKEGLECCYQDMVRLDDDCTKFSMCKSLPQDFVVPPEINGVIIECKSLATGQIVNKDAVSFLQYVESSADRTGTMKPSVLMIGIHSLSRISIRRTMPKTFAHLTMMGWYELYGYNKVDNGSFSNMMPLLAGLNATEATARCRPETKGGLMNCDLIWNHYRDNGYRTAYDEDCAECSTFNWKKQGFRQPPTDHYMRPFIVGLNEVFGYSDDMCFGHRTQAEYIYDDAMQFARIYRGEPSFGILWTNTFSREDPSLPSSMDTKMLDYFQQMQRGGILDETIVMFLSDQGFPNTGTRADAPNDFYDDRLPMFFIWLPKWFMATYPNFVAALYVNKRRLTSAYDIHATLQHILELDESARVEGWGPGQSLFTEVADNRTCMDAGIEADACGCL